MAITARSLKKLHLLLLAAYFGACILAWPLLPESIPVHFDFLGRVTAWTPASMAMWLMLPVLATALSAFIYAVSAEPEAWKLSPDDLERFRALPAEDRARITESADRSTALLLNLATVTFIGLQLAVYSVARGGLTRMPWHAQTIILGSIVLLVLLGFRNPSRLRARIHAACADVSGRTG